jgi:hypothetical protein
MQDKRAQCFETIWKLAIFSGTIRALDFQCERNNFHKTSWGERPNPNAVIQRVEDPNIQIIRAKLRHCAILSTPRGYLAHPDSILSGENLLPLEKTLT